MRAVLPLALLCLVAAAVPAGAARVPAERALYADGPDGRHLLDSGWSTRPDPRDIGLRRGWQGPGSAAGFLPVRIPNTFNAGDLSAAGFRSWVQWYRVRFRLPRDRGATGWRLRFESVNRRADVFLNGQRIGVHEGAHLPFELPADGVRRGPNELVVRVDGRMSPLDLPPSTRPRGWWNYGGILREVYLRRVRRFDLADLQVTSVLGDPVRGGVGALVRNTTRRSQRSAYSLRLRGPGSIRCPAWRRAASPRMVPPGRAFRLRATCSVAGARLWSPDSPTLYGLTVRVPGGQTTQAQVGLRRWSRDRDGHALLNGRRLSLRGASFHEETVDAGAALTSGDREQIVDDLLAVRANFSRQHYPPHPALLEAFDRHGIVFWEQIPVWRLRRSQLREKNRREALSRLRRAVLRDRNHASVMTWSLANETQRAGAAESRYLRAATGLVRRLDRTRLVAVDTSLPISAARGAYRGLDALGINEFVGWYGSTPSTELRSRLDAVRARFPRLALFVTEFGAEANREGSPSEKGTYAFQRDYLDEHLSIIDKTPYLSGALVWLLRDFAVRPGWSGGNPVPEPPLNHKGVFDFDRDPKPAFESVRARFAATPPTLAP